MDRHKRTHFASDAVQSGPTRDPFMAAALSMVPGLGQFYNGETAKGFLFVDVGIVNFLVLCLILLTDPIVRTLTAFSKEFHGRPNFELLRSLHQIHLGSTASFVLVLLIFGFVAYSCRDAYDSAKGRRLRAIYADSAIQISEAASGSYLFHLASIATCAFLALFLIMPPPPKTSTLVMEFVTNPNTEKAIVPPKTKIISNHSSSETASTSTRRDTERPKQTASASPTHAARQQQTEAKAPSSNAAPKTQKAPDPKPTPPAIPVVHPVAQKQTQQIPTPTPTPLHAQPTPSVVNPVPKPMMSSAAAGTAPKPLLLAQNPAPFMPAMPSPTALMRTAVPGAAPMPKASLATGAGGQGPQPTPSIIGAHSGSNIGTPTPAPASSGPRGTHEPSGGPNGAPQPTRVATSGPSSSGNIGPAVTPVLGGSKLGPRAHGTDDSDSPGGRSPHEGKDSHVGKSVDFSAYMAALQRRIKSHWFPNKIPTSNRVQVTFKISVTGELSGLRLEKSSGVSSVDQAALKAVQEAAPFPPLPPGSADSDVSEDGRVSIQFTFDYNVFGNDGHGKMLSY